MADGGYALRLVARLNALQDCGRKAVQDRLRLRYFFERAFDRRSKKQAVVLEFLENRLFGRFSAGLKPGAFGHFVEKHARGERALRAVGGRTIEVVLSTRRRSGFQEKYLHVDRAIARGEFEALDAAADVRLVHLRAAPVTNRHSRASRGGRKCHGTMQKARVVARLTSKLANWKSNQRGNKWR